MLVSPKKLFELTYGKDASRFNGLDIIIKEVNDVSERWQGFVSKNFIPKPQNNKRIKAINDLNYLLDELDFQRDPKADLKLKRIKSVIEYIEKQGNNES